MHWAIIAQEQKGCFGENQTFKVFKPMVAFSTNPYMGL